MWPWTAQENEFITKHFNTSENKKTIDAFAYKMKTMTLDIAEMQVDMAAKMFGLVNKHTDNFFSVYENVFNKQITEYRNTVRSMCKE